LIAIGNCEADGGIQPRQSCQRGLTVSSKEFIGPAITGPDVCEEIGAPRTVGGLELDGTVTQGCVFFASFVCQMTYFGSVYALLGSDSDGWHQ
jgi:hypothetical protein